MALTRTAAPAGTPITLAEAKTQLGVTSSDDDTLIGALVDAAVSRIDGPSGIGVALVTQTWTQTLDAWPYDGEIRLGLWPVQSVSSITYVDTNGDTQTVSSSNYRLVAGDPYLVVPVYGGSWPGARYQRSAITVTFVAGMGSVADWATATAYPEMARIKQALLLGSQMLYTQTQNAGGAVRSESLDGVGSITYAGDAGSASADSTMTTVTDLLLFDLRRGYVRA